MTIHVGLIGGGNISGAHARAAHETPGVSIAAVYGTNKVWEGGFRGRAIYLATVASDSTNPSFESSPWMRGAPQRGLAKLILRIRSMSSREIEGRLCRWRRSQPGIVGLAPRGVHRASATELRDQAFAAGFAEDRD
jgi:hypothetical protein